MNQLETNQGMPKLRTPPVIADISPSIEQPTTHIALRTDSRGLGSRAVARRKRATPIINETCCQVLTSCTRGRLWWLELSSTPGLSHTCRTGCARRCVWYAKLRMTLTWLNLPFAVTANFGFSSRNGQYELKPPLSFQHVVKNTSPGFEAIFLCGVNILSVGVCKQRLRDLARCDVYFKDHVNPEGQSYLRVSLTRCGMLLRRATLSVNSI